MTSSIPSPGDGKLYPLSFQQQTMYLIELHSPGALLNPNYIVWITLRLKGPLRYELLQAAFDDVLERQAALRTRLVLVADGDVAQEELSGLRAPVELAEEAAGEAGLPALLERLAATHIPMDTPPLARLSVHRLAPDDHVLFLGLNHFACDATGLYVAADELVRAYEARREGRRLPPDVKSYGEYSAWQAKHYASRLEQDASFWGEYLAGLKPYEVRQDLPFTPGPVGEGGASLRVPLMEAQELQRLQRFATAHRVSPLVVFLAAFHAVLGHRTASEDRLSVTHFDQRDHPSAREMAGLFLCPVPVRIPFARDVPVRDAFAPMLENVLAAYRRAYMPAMHYLAAYPEALPGLVGQAAPWVFVVQYQPNAGTQTYCFGEARGGILRAGVVAGQEPGMSLRLRRTLEGELWLRVGYDPTQWRSDSMAALADRYGRALRELLDNPSRTPAHLLGAIAPW